MENETPVKKCKRSTDTENNSEQESNNQDNIIELKKCPIKRALLSKSFIKIAEIKFNRGKNRKYCSLERSLHIQEVVNKCEDFPYCDSTLCTCDGF